MPFPQDPMDWVYDPAQRHDYSPDNTYVRSTDDKGHFVCVRVNVPPHVRAMLASIVAKPGCPWRSVPDIFRDAVHHRLVWYAENKDDLEVPAAIVQERLASEIEALADEDRRAAALVASTKAELGYATERDDTERLASLYLVGTLVVDSLRPFWAERMAAVLKPYAHLAASE